MENASQDNPIDTPIPEQAKPIVTQGQLVVATTDEISTPNEKHVDKSEGGQPGNDNRMKWKTPEERIAACDKVCEELKLGYPREYLYTASWKTISRYMQDFPVEFPSDMIEEAEKDGIRRLLSIGYGGMAGKVPGFNSRTWEFIIQNRSKWKLRQDTTTNDKELPTPIIGGQSTNAIPNDNSDK